MAKRQKDDDEIGPLYAAERAVRLIIEETGADAVVVLWTSQKKRSTRFYRHQFGNAMLCSAMVTKSSEDQDASEDKDDEEDED
jgi:hypothetical protein